MLLSLGSQGVGHDCAAELNRNLNEKQYKGNSERLFFHFTVYACPS